MAITEPDIKKLWGKAGGYCSYPDCGENCVPHLTNSGDVIIGEMAHVIAQKPTGPRARGVGGRDTYENLILLCPTHHTLIDKAPDDYPPEMLHKWKTEHEGRIERAIKGLRFESSDDLLRYTRRLLLENREIYVSFGPESAEAKRNPLTPMVKLWEVRKATTIVPNNRRIIAAFEQNQNLITDEIWLSFLRFREHAIAFERSTYERMDSNVVPRFPVEFAQAIGVD